MRLTRETRTWLGGATRGDIEPRRNSWAGTQEGRDLDRFLIIRVTVSGESDRKTGYVCDIRHLDQLAHATVGERIRASAGRGSSTLSAVAVALAGAFASAAEKTPRGTRLQSIELLLSPYTRVAIERGDQMMLRLTQSFEFSASHRLAIPSLTDNENHELFGKCSNPQGHGHNYVFEVTVGGTADDTNGTVADVGAIDRVVQEHVIEAFDHKNLNSQCPEFASLNPTVENIAAVIFSRLEGKFGTCELDRVRVWETPKTSAEVTREYRRE